MRVALTCFVPIMERLCLTSFVGTGVSVCADAVIGHRNNPAEAAIGVSHVVGYLEIILIIE